MKLNAGEKNLRMRVAFSLAGGLKNVAAPAGFNRQDRMIKIVVSAKLKLRAGKPAYVLPLPIARCLSI